MILYNCSRVSNKSYIKTFGAKQLFLCVLHFTNEHGHDLSGALQLVSVGEGQAKIVKYPEDILPDESPLSEWDEVQTLIDKFPGLDFDVYNEKEFSEMIENYKPEQ